MTAVLMALLRLVRRLLRSPRKVVAVSVADELRLPRDAWIPVVASGSWPLAVFSREAQVRVGFDLEEALPPSMIDGTLGVPSIRMFMEDGE